MKTSTKPVTESALPPHVIEEMKRLKLYFPFRIVYGAVKGSLCDTGAVMNMRKPNGLARDGWTVEILS